jgi:hypothetical protein
MSERTYTEYEVVKVLMEHYTSTVRRGDYYIEGANSAICSIAGDLGIELNLITRTVHE